MDVDLDWHMHQISDGQSHPPTTQPHSDRAGAGERRRVQLVMGLMEPWDVLLLDEVTVDLDVLVRDELLQFLQAESETRGATIICTCSFPIFQSSNHLTISYPNRCHPHL